MGFHTGAWAKIWEMDKRERYTKLRISISKKDKKTDQYIDDFSGFVNLAGSAHTNADMLHVGDRFKIGDCDVSTRYDKQKKVTYTNYSIFSFDKGDDAKGPNNIQSGTTEAETTDDDDDEDLPF